MNTVLKFTPLRGGGWSESQHQLITPDDSLGKTHPGGTIDSFMERGTSEKPTAPIWGDSMQIERKVSSFSESSLSLFEMHSKDSLQSVRVSESRDSLQNSPLKENSAMTAN